MKRIHLFMLCVLMSLGTLQAQNEQYVIQGKVVEEASQQAVEFATVVLMDKNNDQMLTGTTTDLDGNFKFETTSLNAYIEISFLGFVSKRIEDFTANGLLIDLGKISLSQNSQTLEEVVVRAEKSSTEFKLDKRVFNVGKDLSSTGASALEVLNNVPSVNVNIEGQISLRGSSGVQILINGKPSVLASEEGNALGTITAEMIERIEVITNPSAKYDAEGTSGIINIVIKKEERKGLNGSVTLNTGAPHNHSLGLSLNRRTEKFNLFSQLGIGYRELPQDSENINTNLNTNTSIRSFGEEFRNEMFYNFILGSDYMIDDNNVITLSGNFSYEIEDQPSLTNFSFQDETGAVVSEWFREETTEATNPKYQFELQYKRDFKDDEDHDLIFSALGRSFSKDQSSEFLDVTTFGLDNDATQQTATNFSEAIYTFKLDYTKPVTEEVTIETGAQYVINDVSNAFEVRNFVDGIWVENPDFTNIFDYDQKVFGAYVTGAYEGKQWGIKAGMRVEHTDLETLLVTTDQGNSQNFANLFPSFATSYKFTERWSMQGGYSRRIFRPRLWDLNPFFNIRNNFNIRTGNPDLLPEFTDSYELNSIYILGKASLNFGVYYRYTTEVVERISFFEDNVNITTPQNIGTNRATGLEFNFKYTPNKWLGINGDVNYNYFNREGDFEGTSFDFTADVWSSKLTSKFKLPAGIDFEMTGQFQSREQTVQGVVSENLFLDLGLRKKILNGKGVLNLSVRDLFASRIRESTINQPDFFLYSFGQRGRFVTLGFSYGFGKGEAMEYSSGRRR